MKILEVIPYLDSGGAEVFLVDLSNELAKRENVEVTILTLFPVNTEHFLVKKISPSINLVSFAKRGGIDLKMIFQIYKYIKQEKFDIAHFHVNAIIYAIFSVLFYRKCRYFATIHSDAYKEAEGLHRYFRQFMFRSRLMTPVTISKESDRTFRELYKRGALLIYNGVPPYRPISDVDLSSYRSSSKTKVFVNVASIQPLKNQLSIAKAFQRLADDGEDVVLLIIGRSTEVHRQCAEELKSNLPANAFLLGEVSNPRDYMKKADYFILASHYEGLPITVLESFTAGCIPVVTAVGGNLDVIKDRSNGYLIADPSEDTIYSTIKSVLVSPEEELSKIRGMVSESAERYTIQHCADQYLKAFSN